MNSSERTVHIAHQLFKIRDTARACFGDRYPAEVRPVMDLIVQVAQARQTNTLAVGQEMAKRLIDTGRSPLMVLAATVELSEPSPEVTQGSATLESMRVLLARHLATRPAIPQPFLPNSLAGLTFQKALETFSDRRRLLEHEIFKLEHPRTAGLDRQPRVISGPGPGERRGQPARLRR
jgi:hypothetical protein